MTKYYMPYIATVFAVLFIFAGYNAIVNNSQNEPGVHTADISERNTDENNTKINEYKDMKKYKAILHTTEGSITIALNADQTPKTVQNFVDLANKGFYDNTIFHRVIDGFMIQGGDGENHDGTGGPGYKFDDEPFTGEYTRGTVAMANAGPNTNGSQFFIMHQEQALPKNYVIFGQVIDGMNTVDKIASSQVSPHPFTGEMSVPTNPTKVLSVDISEN